jgi:hypothetical protein
VTVPLKPKKLESRIGQLSLKEEAAGKVRVFAMVDIWTQSVLKPLHTWLFDLFKSLPNDGTHNQDAAFIRAQEKAVRYNQAYCYDLSAATDRLPIKLQVSILDSLFSHIKPEVQYVGMTYGTAWARLLTDREYILPQDKVYNTSGPMSLRYAVGQPMGALSSWAMLNLCHHMLLQMINYTIHHKVVWYDNYEVLGDDIVIFDKEVADRYKEIMEVKLGVKCNEAKSLIAPNRAVIEFAKRVSIGLDEVSPLSWRQLRSLDSLAGRCAIVTDWLTRKVKKHPMRVIYALCGAKWGSGSSEIFAIVAFLSALVNRGVLPLSSFINLLIDVKNPMRYFTLRILENLRVPLLRNLMLQYVQGKPLDLPHKLFHQVERARWVQVGFVRGFLEDRIVDLTKEIFLIFKKGSETGLVPYFGDIIPQDLLQSIFYPGTRYLDKPKLVDLNQLDEAQLLDRISSLEGLLRDLEFYKQTKVRRKLEVENSLKLLSLVERSKRKGSISIEITR